MKVSCGQEAAVINWVFETFKVAVSADAVHVDSFQEHPFSWE
jgi:hypothetical protein